MNFDDLQKNWKMQEAPGGTGDIRTELGILGNVKATQQKIIRANIIMTVIAALTILAFVFVLRPVFTPNTIWFDVGIGLVFSAAFALGLIQWIKSSRWKKHVNVSSKVYVEQALKSIRQLSNANQKWTPFFMVIIVLGINLIYLDIFWDESLKLRIVMHILLNSVMLSVGIASVYFSKRYRDNAYTPIIRELEELQQQLNKV